MTHIRLQVETHDGWEADLELPFTWSLEDAVSMCVAMDKQILSLRQDAEQKAREQREALIRKATGG